MQKIANLFYYQAISIRNYEFRSKHIICNVHFIIDNILIDINRMLKVVFHVKILTFLSTNIFIALRSLKSSGQSTLECLCEYFHGRVIF